MSKVEVLTESIEGVTAIGPSEAVTRIVLLVALMGAASGCGGGSSPTTPSPVVNGTYAGTMSLSLNGASGTEGHTSWVLLQSGTTVSGSMTNRNSPTSSIGSVGTVTGTLSNSTLTFSASVLPGGVVGDPTCRFTMTGTASGVTGSTIVSSIAGTYSCTSPTYNASLTGRLALAKQ